MRTAAYDPSRNKKKSRSPKLRPKSLGVQQTNAKSIAADASPCAETATTAKDVPADTFPVNSGSDDSCQQPETKEQSLGSDVQPSTEAKLAESTDNVSLSAVTVTSAGSSEEPSSLTDAAGKDYVNTQGVRFITSDTSSDIDAEGGRMHIPYGLPCVRELLRFLISLINPMERQNSEAMIHVGLKLLTVAMETGADVIASVPSLLTLIQDETCRFLFALLNSERISVLAAACRLCFLLFESVRTRLKFQLETYITKLMDIVAHESPKVSYERRLVALEAIAQLCRIPGNDESESTQSTLQSHCHGL